MKTLSKTASTYESIISPAFSHKKFEPANKGAGVTTENEE